MNYKHKNNPKKTNNWFNQIRSSCTQFFSIEYGFSKEPIQKIENIMATMPTQNIFLSDVDENDKEITLYLLDEIQYYWNREKLVGLGADIYLLYLLIYNRSKFQKIRNKYVN